MTTCETAIRVVVVFLMQLKRCAVTEVWGIFPEISCALFSAWCFLEVASTRSAVFFPMYTV